MRRKRPHVRFLLLLVLSGAVFAGLQLGGYAPTQRVSTAQARFPTTEQIEADLQFRLELHPGGKTITAGSHPWVRSKLVNTSKNTTHRLAGPAYGWNIERRGPQVSWVATIDRGDGKQVPLPKERVGVCGTCMAYDSLRPRIWLVLLPGRSLDDLGSPPNEFQQAGRVRLQAHYDFRGERGLPPSPNGECDKFALAPAFSLASNVVEFDVIRPLDVRLRVLGPLKAKHRTRLSELISITVVNQSAQPVKCSMPTLTSPGGHVYLEMEASLGWRPDLCEQRAVYALEDVLLESGEVVPLIGKGEFANGLDGWWEYPVKEVVRLRAGYKPSRENVPTVFSEWVEVKVEQ